MRLGLLADFCVQELKRRGLKDVEKEASIPGAGREKQWDVAWCHEGKYRLGISLKSLLKNLGGTVPNRIDDLVGEVANAQLHSPEIVIGYIMIFNVAEDSFSQKHGSTWYDLFRDRAISLSGRRPPSWTTGTVEDFVLVEVDFSSGSSILATSQTFDAFFDTLGRAGQGTESQRHHYLTGPGCDGTVRYGSTTADVHVVSGSTYTISIGSPTESLCGFGGRARNAAASADAVTAAAIASTASSRPMSLRLNCPSIASVSCSAEGRTRFSTLTRSRNPSSFPLVCSIGLRPANERPETHFRVDLAHDPPRLRVAAQQSIDVSALRDNGERLSAEYSAGRLLWLRRLASS